MRCDPLSCLILPPPEGSVRQLMRCWYVGGEGDVITFISHQVLSGIQWRRQAGPTLFHKMEISHGFYHLLKSIAIRRTEKNALRYLSLFLWLEKSFIPRALDENGVASVVQSGIIPLSRQHVNNTYPPAHQIF